MISLLIRLNWDATSNTYSNNAGVTIRPKDFGGTGGVEYLALFKPYFHNFVDYFVNELGYKRGSSIRAAPYDWRLAAGLKVSSLQNAKCNPIRNFQWLRIELRG